MINASWLKDRTIIYFFPYTHIAYVGIWRIRVCCAFNFEFNIQTFWSLFAPLPSTCCRHNVKTASINHPPNRIDNILHILELFTFFSNDIETFPVCYIAYMWMSDAIRWTHKFLFQFSSYGRLKFSITSFAKRLQSIIHTYTKCDARRVWVCMCIWGPEYNLSTRRERKKMR